jgi:hypothetical protein
MLICNKALQSGNHIAKIERIGDPSDRNLMLFYCNLYNWKINILNNAWPSSIHLLNKLPNSIIYNEIILLFFNIASKIVSTIKKL